MFSKILTFSVLSVFCVFTAISYVYAHTPANPVYNGSITHNHDDFITHTHENVAHWEIGEQIDPGYEAWDRQQGEGENPDTPGQSPRPSGNTINHEHLDPTWGHTDHSGVPTQDSVEEDTNTDTDERHSHSFTHQHGLYESHTHTVRHEHDGPHPYEDPHIWDNDHSGVDTDSTRNQPTVDQPTNNQPTNNQPTNNQPTNNQPTVNQPTVNQPTVNQPTVNQPTGTQPTTVATGGTPAGTSSPQPVGPVATQSAPQERQPGSPLMQPIRVTEYMVRDWSKGGVIGNSNLPQWIELYNPNIEAVNLKGWTFQYATRRFRNQPYKVHTLTLAATEDGFSIPGGGVAILATQRLPARKFSGIEATQVYNLNIENVLKRGWVLTDTEGREVQRLGREAFSALRDPVAPPHQDGARVSHHAYRSESPSESYYYGHSGDIGSPGFYEQPAPAAPSAVRRKQVGTWGSLKRTP